MNWLVVAGMRAAAVHQHLYNREIEMEQELLNKFVGKLFLLVASWHRTKMWA